MHINISLGKFCPGLLLRFGNWRLFALHLRDRIRLDQAKPSCPGGRSALPLKYDALLAILWILNCHYFNCICNLNLKVLWQCIKLWGSDGVSESLFMLGKLGPTLARLCSALRSYMLVWRKSVVFNSQASAACAGTVGFDVFCFQGSIIGILARGQFTVLANQNEFNKITNYSRYVQSSTSLQDFH